MSRSLYVAVVGLGFGEDFLPIYAAHPDVGVIAIVDNSEQRLTEVGERQGIADRFTSYDAVLANPRWDAVHIMAPVSFHADYTVAPSAPASTAPARCRWGSNWMNSVRSSMRSGRLGSAT